ncbi:MAG: SurA domain protein [Edaphobacter sp.]|nr:SurA domain protein [Edaphobacter sp.]
MRSMAQATMRRRLKGAAACLLAGAAISVLMVERLWAGQAAAPLAPTEHGPEAAAPQAKTPPPANAAVAPAASELGEVLDRLVAVVNGEVILESDVDEERRFEEVQPYRSAPTLTRDRIIERLIDRMLILQQEALEPEEDVTDKNLDAQIATLRKDIPACQQYHCGTVDGWKKYLGDHGFTEQEFSARWKQRMELLKFIEVRFRNGIAINDAEVKAYYEKNMLPEYAKRNVKPPKLDTIRPRIEEVLLQQEVGALLRDWLKSLRAQGSVKMITPGEVAP